MCQHGFFVTTRVPQALCCKMLPGETTKFILFCLSSKSSLRAVVYDKLARFIITFDMLFNLNTAKTSKTRGKKSILVALVQVVHARYGVHAAAF